MVMLSQAAGAFPDDLEEAERGTVGAVGENSDREHGA
jgi:hypothetical protein